VNSKNDKQISGELLVADFQSAFAALATAEYAVGEAERSENNVVSELSSLGGHSYLNPGSISSVRQNYIGMASLNAHVMKVQAAQLQQMSREQLAALQAQVSDDYVGRKVRVTAFPGNESPFDAVWFNDQTGYRSNIYKKSAIVGTVSEVGLAKNLLILKPKLFPRMLNRELSAYFVYVVDPSNLEPAVNIELL
jgi:hypothetical protein